MKTKLMLYEKWGIYFEGSYHVPVNPEQHVEYVTKQEILNAITESPQITAIPKKGVLKFE